MNFEEVIPRLRGRIMRSADGVSHFLLPGEGKELRNLAYLRYSLQTTEFWRCEERGTCKGRIFVTANREKREITKDFHEQNAPHDEAFGALARMKEQGRKTAENTTSKTLQHFQKNPENTT